VRIGTDVDWTAISVGTGHACGIRSGASGVFCWGKNDKGQAGNGTVTDVLTPTVISSGTSFTRVSAGDVHTCAIAAGTLFCWGDNSSGLLGTGDTATHTAPFQIGIGTTWTQIALGKTDTYGTQSGTPSTFWDWGLNDQGQLGDGTAFNGTPQAITVP
jgi:alpha-tubulin suppressor-like RCC1 family protein